jgi:hypothetical protein
MKYLGIVLILLASFALFQLGKKPNINGQSTGTPIADEAPRRVYTGAWAGGFWDDGSKKLNTDALSGLEKRIGTKFAIANFFTGWSYLPDAAFAEKLDEISDNGWVPMVSTNPFFFDKCPDSGIPLYRAIAQGACDDFLASVAKNLKSYGKPLMLRFAWEMNLPDMYWSIQKTNGEPLDFVDAWKHFHDILENNGADNVIWVLSFLTSHSGTVPYRDLYPGDAYVDWVALDGYNWGNTQKWSGWTSFDGVYRKSYEELIAVADKPVMLSEVSSAPDGGNKADWLRDMLMVQIPNHFTKVGAVVFFNENKSEGESVDWRLDTDDVQVMVVRTALREKIYRSRYP